MELKAQPRDNANSQFVKFINIGDSVKGLFVSYDVVDGNFGPKKELVLKTKEGIKTVTCSTNLAQILDEHVETIHGKVLTITLVGTKAVGKPQPMKIFKVDASDPKKGAAPVIEADENDADEDISF